MVDKSEVYLDTRLQAYALLCVVHQHFCQSLMASCVGELGEGGGSSFVSLDLDHC